MLVSRMLKLKVSCLALCFFTQTIFAIQQPLTFLAEELPPYHFINQQGEVDGALVEIVEAVLKQANLTGNIQIRPFARSFQATKTQANTFMFSLLKTPNRDKSFQWVGETYRSYAVLVGLKDNKSIKLSSLNDAQAFFVGTIRGYHSAHFLKTHGFKEHQNLSLSVTSKHMWAMLFNKRIDLVLTNYMALDRDIKKAGFKPGNITPYLSITNFPNELNIATGLDTSKEIVQQLAKALTEIKDAGIYQKIINKYDL